MSAVYVNVPMFIYNRSMTQLMVRCRDSTQTRKPRRCESFLSFSSLHSLHLHYFFLFDSLCVVGFRVAGMCVFVHVCLCMCRCVWTMQIDGCNPGQIKRALILATITVRTQISIDLQEPDPDQFLEETEVGRAVEAEAEQSHVSWFTVAILTVITRLLSCENTWNSNMKHRIVKRL